MTNHPMRILVACTSGACDGEAMEDPTVYEVGTVMVEGGR